MILSSEINDKDLNIYGNQNIAGKSTCSSSSTTTKSLDDVWNDISLSSFHHHITTTAATTHPLPFQEFFSPPTTTNPYFGDSTQFKSPPSTTSFRGGVIISLNSEPINNFLYKDRTSTTSKSCKCRELPSFITSSTIKPLNFNDLASLSSSLPVKRAQREYCEKHKRLMKNRESASRSRARKQVRTDELEIEVKRLTKENAMLKSQLRDQLKLPNAIPAQVPKRSRLKRASTAPF